MLSLSCDLIKQQLLCSKKIIFVLMIFVSCLRSFSVTLLSIRLMSTSAFPFTSQSNVLLTMEPDCDRVSLRLTYHHNSNSKLFFLNRSKDEMLSVAFRRLSLNLERFIGPKGSKLKWTGKKDKSSRSNGGKGSSIDIYLVNDGKLVDENTLHCQAWSANSVLFIGNRGFKVLMNSPTVETIKLSNRLLTNFPVYPVISLKYAKIDDCNFSWYRFKSPEIPQPATNTTTVFDDKDVIKELVSNDFIYYPTDQDVGHRLLVEVTPKDPKASGLISSFASNELVEQGPVDCSFLERQKLTSNLTKPGSFRVVSYNLLADYYTSMKSTATEIFPYCPKEFLKIDYRKPLLIKELIGYKGDIVCLQEVDRKFFDYELKDILRLQGDMEGLFLRKSGRDVKVSEGIAIFYRKAKFKYLEELNHDLTELCLNNVNLTDVANAVERNEQLLKRLKDRNTVVQCVLLEDADSSNKALLVINTHLYSNADSDHIRLLQGAIIILYVENLLKEYKLKYPHLQLSPVFTGDFNSDPANGVYKLYTNGYIETDHVDWRSVADEAIEGLRVEHNLRLKSAYGTPEFTNYTQNYIGCLDYIFYDSQTIELDSLVPLPSRDQVSSQTAIPSSIFPSDHLALIATLKWKS